MASSDDDEMDEAIPATSDKRAPPITVQGDTSPGFSVDPRRALEMGGDQAPSQDPSSQDNPKPKDSKEGITSVEGSNRLFRLPFPKKLWRIVEDDAFTSVRWSHKGDTVVIEVELFQRQVLSRKGAEKIFESDSLKTFIRLMNLYGFCKIRPSNSICHPGTRRRMIYHNPNFQRNKPLLLKNIKKRYKWMTTAALPGSRALPPKSKKRQVSLPRHSLINYREDTKESNGETQKKAPSAQGPSGTQPFQFPGLRCTSSVMIAHSPNDPGGPSGECISGIVPLAPRFPAGTDSTGDLATSYLNFSLYDSVMYLFNTCYSILIAALSVIGERGELDTEGPSDRLSVLCEHIPDDPVP
ncbi:heat shock transcription factor, X-linked member 3-like [Artibeus jamaicensis]|uniref:heat shock transcription factor, X-linked member 3-like n=1 Tax=Artibeus jamaicensis TaxID=9417 RepID=UPI00235AB103|nr:heat shock transcription factor, X-linked member 3-like [Artibeus jamaicensis]